MPEFGNPQSEWCQIPPSESCDRGWTRHGMCGTMFQMGPEDGYAVSITAGLFYTNGLAPTKCAIYDENYNLVGCSEERMIGNHPPPYQYYPETFLFSAPYPFLYGDANYLLICWSGYGTEVVFIGVNVEPGFKFQLTTNNYYDPPDPPCPDRFIPYYESEDMKTQIYCTYQLGQPPECSEYTNKQECEAVGCHWYNNGCHGVLPECLDLINQQECIDYGCYWCDGVCQSTPCEIICSDYTTQSECEDVGCYWWNGSCHNTTPACNVINNQNDCLDYGCYWCNNACQATPCDVVCSDYTTQSECEAAGCYWWSNNTCHSAEEPSNGEGIPIEYIAIVGIVVGGIAIAALLLRKRK